MMEAEAESSDVHRWLAGQRHQYTRARRAPLSGLDGWHADRSAGHIAHRSGRFFRVEGLRVAVPGAAVARWSQPIINQPETGILGILVQRRGGRLHCLMQAKAEPGNHNGLQLSPTVQATRSNYTRVHGGTPVPYLDHFRAAAGGRVLVDVLQSEQGAWFHRKTNRNMVVEIAPDTRTSADTSPGTGTSADTSAGADTGTSAGSGSDAGRAPEAAEGFRWLPLSDVYRLLAHDDLVNMDARSVLACLLPHLTPSPTPLPGDGAGGRDASAGAALAQWLAGERRRVGATAELAPLTGLPGWHWDEERVSHETGCFFDIIGVDVEAGGREIGRWSQPMLHPYGVGLTAFVTARVDGEPHVLVQARHEPGLTGGVEIGPTVQCQPDNYKVLPPAARPRFLDAVVATASGTAPAARRPLVDVTLSDEGGRFYHARNRHLVIETDEPPSAFTAPGYRWVRPGVLAHMLRRGQYVNMQARSLLLCLYAAHARAGGDGESGTDPARTERGEDDGAIPRAGR